MNELISWFIAAGVILLLANTNVADGLLSALDLSDNLKRAADWARGVRGVPAAVSAFCFFILAYVFGALAYRYDLLPTYRFIQPVAQDVLASGAEWLSLFAVFLTLLPTLIELASVGLVQRSIKALEFMTYFFIFFDLVTDYREAAALVDVWQRGGLFDPLPFPLAGAAVALAKLGWTFAASFAFEFLAILFAVTGLLLAANIRATSTGGGAR
jgi:surface polysaccharide O-acyltransferase-like enzyme